MGDTLSARRLAASAIVALLLVGCGGEDAGNQSQPDVDVAALDSGNYPAAPQAISDSANVDEGRLREGQRLLDSVALAYEADPKFAFQSVTGASTVLHPRFLPSGDISRGKFEVDAPGFVAGVRTRGKRRAGTSNSRELTTYVLLFGSEQQAATAAKNLEASAFRIPYEKPVGDGKVPVSKERVQIPGHPTAQAHWAPDTRLLYSWLAQGRFVYWTMAYDQVMAPIELGPMADLIAKGLTRQLEAIKNFVATPEDKLATLPRDIDGLLARTLPGPAKGWEYEQPGVNTAHGALHYAPRTADAKLLYEDTGVDLVAHTSTAVVYRTRDDQQAVRLAGGLADALSRTMDAAATPPNLTGARCFQVRGKPIAGAGDPVSCLTAHDRYTAAVTGANIQEVHQKVAAQYKILASGD